MLITFQHVTHFPLSTVLQTQPTLKVRGLPVTWRTSKQCVVYTRRSSIIITASSVLGSQLCKNIKVKHRLEVVVLSLTKI